MIFVFHPTHHQVTKSSQNTKTLALHHPCQDQFLLLENISHITLEIFVRIESRQFSKTMIFVFHPTHHQFTKSSQNTKIMEFGYVEPPQDQFLLLPNFSDINLDAFVRIEYIQFCKTMIFVFQPTHHQVTKSSQNTKIMELAPTLPRSIPFAPKLLPQYFGGICEDRVQPVFQINDFRFSPNTPQSHKIK